MLSGGSFYREWVAILPYVVKIGKSFYIYFLHKVSNSIEFLCISIVNLLLKINQSWIFVYLFHFTKLVRDLGGRAAQCKQTTTLTGIYVLRDNVKQSRRFQMQLQSCSKLYLLLSRVNGRQCKQQTRTVVLDDTRY